MAQMQLQHINTDAWRTNLQRELLSIANDSYVLTEINYILFREMKPYIPRDTGALIESTQIGPSEIRWVKPYARYQYYGEVYGPNYWVPITRGSDGNWDKNGPWGWRSPPGKGSKYPTGRALTYHSPGTTSFWYETMMMQRKSSVNQKITAFLKRVCKNRGLS